MAHIEEVLDLMQVPSILSEEVQYNPFMLTTEPSLKEALGVPASTPPSRVLAELRRQKNRFNQTTLNIHT